jgi:small-conductance mechanosensitive channel
MSNDRDNYWDDEEDDDTSFTPSFDSDTDLVKKLRKALKAEQRRNKELETSLGDLTKSQRERVLKDVLSSRGVNAKVASFVPNDLDASEEAISGWLDQNADVFGFEIQQKNEISQQDVAQLRQMDNVTSGALSPDKAEDLGIKIQGAQSADEILNLIYGAQS